MKCNLGIESEVFDCVIWDGEHIEETYKRLVKVFTKELISKPWRYILLIHHNHKKILLEIDNKVYFSDCANYFNNTKVVWTRNIDRYEFLVTKII